MFQAYIKALKKLSYRICKGRLAYMAVKISALEHLTDGTNSYGLLFTSGLFHVYLKLTGEVEGDKVYSKMLAPNDAII